MLLHRIVAGLMLSTGLAAGGFAAFALLAASILVRPGEGLAGVATVVLSGAFGAGVGIAIAALLAWKLPKKALTPSAVGGLLLGIAVSLVLVSNRT